MGVRSGRIGGAAAGPRAARLPLPRRIENTDAIFAVDLHSNLDGGDWIVSQAKQEFDAMVSLFV